MNYFCRTTIEAARDKIRSFFMVIEASQDSNSPPCLKKEVLLEQHEYKEFVQRYYPKSTIMVDYILYQTEEQIHAAMQPEVFEELIASGKATTISSGELQIEPTDKKDKGGVVRRKKKTSPFLILGFVSGIAVVAIVSFWGGKMLALSHNGGNAVTNSNPGTVAEDGMIIPVQNELENQEKAVRQAATDHAQKQKELAESSDTLATAEKVFGGTYVQSLAAEERQRREAQYIPNGVKYANGGGI